MGRGLCTQKGSCRYQYDRHLLSSESLFCSVCKHHATFSDRVLREMVKSKRIVVDNVCEDVIGTLSPGTKSARDAFLSVISRKRQRTPKINFSPGEPLRSWKSEKRKKPKNKCNTKNVGESCNILTDEGVPIKITVDNIVKEMIPNTKKIKCHISYTIEEQPGIKNSTEMIDLSPASVLTSSIGNNISSTVTHSSS